MACWITQVVARLRVERLIVIEQRLRIQRRRGEGIVDVVSYAARHAAQGAQALLLHADLLRLAQGLVGDLEFPRALGDPGLEQVIGVPDVGFGAFALRDLELQAMISPLQRSRTREAQRRRNEPHQQKRGRDRSQGGYRLDPAREPVNRLPDRPDLHQMGQPAGDDEHRETHVNPVELQIFAAPDEIEERERDREVRQRDERIGDDVQRQYPGLPLVAHSMGHEPRRREQSIEVLGHYAVLAILLEELRIP
jgi:hypothetical protein